MEQYAPTLSVKVARADGVEQQSPCAEVARGVTKERPPRPTKDVEGDDITSIRAPSTELSHLCETESMQGTPPRVSEQGGRCIPDENIIHVFFYSFFLTEQKRITGWTKASNG